MIPGIRSTIAGLIIGKNKKTNFEDGDVAATGNSQGTAAALSFVVNNVTAADGTKGVILPSNPGTTCSRFVVVYNSVATNGLPVYPPSSGTINGGTANAAVTIEGKTLALFMSTDGTNWGAIYTANS